MKYATREDVAMWLGYVTETGEPDTAQLPDNIDKMIRNASRLIDYVTLNQINGRIERHLDVAMNAVSAQVEYWIDGIGESSDVNPAVSGYSAGNFSIDFDGGRMPKLADRARRELWMGGLLNRRVISL